jgi:hypothetical protein
MKEPTRIEVDGETYTIAPYVTSTGIKLLTDISLLLGAPLLKLLKGSGDAKSLLDSEVDLDAMGSVVMDLQERVGGDAVDAMLKRILSGTLIGTTSQSVVQDYDSRFMGRYKHLFKLVAASLKAQYGDFLGDAVVLAGSRRGGSRR